MPTGTRKPIAPGRPAGARSVGRRLAAVLGADVLGYGLLMERAAESTLHRVGVELERLRREIEKSHGRVLSFAGDGLMAEFPSVVEALKCALRVQADLGRRNRDLPPDERILFRIGLDVGEIVAQGDRIGGTTVNIAARLEAIAEPGGIALSEAVHQQVHRVVSAAYAFTGEHRLKNIRDPIAVHAIPAADCSVWAAQPMMPRRTPLPGAREIAPDYRASLAVLPFRTLQKDQSDAYFAEGMVDDIIHALDGLKDMLVISRSTTRMFARTPIDPRWVGHELDVRYVLHGSVRRARDGLRIVVELCEAQSGTVIWIDRFDGTMTELFDLQDRIAHRVATSVAPHLHGRELLRALRKRPENMTAYDLTLRALDLFHRMDREALGQARVLLLDAIEHDPNYVPAHTHLASLGMTLLGQGWSDDPAGEAETAGRAAYAAVRRDPNDPLALAFRGQYESFIRKDYRAALDTHGRAVAAGPNCAWAWGLSSLPLGYTGDAATAVAHAERAVSLSPLGPEAYWHEYFLSQALYLNGRFREAVAWGRLSATHAAANVSNLRTLAASLVANGETEAAREVAARMLEVFPGFSLADYRQRTHFGGAVADTLMIRLRAAGLPE